ncbi:hypothetical protein [Gordonia sp. SL306]|uniref:hypothetical protein n=1 Tax=Gordonia sp. SL306 TaxID=2995145 RepID=UPI00226D47EC|nr:hypothetical protein [Gordonia sp. SL306]WAC57655.1 hypothetical protein OVA31_10675 [Gordonia sp. SL306]
MSGDRSEWFADVPAWPATSGTPASELAHALADARLVTAGAVATSSSSAAIAEQEPPPPEARESQPEPGIDDAPTVRSALSDDDLFEQMRVRTVTPKGSGGPKHFWKDHRGPIIGLAAAIVVVGVAAAVAVSQSLTGGEVSDTEQAAPPPPSAAPSSSTPEDCASTVEDGVTSGRDAGGQTSGPGVIKAFNYAYYVQRSASKARAVATPNAVATRDVMQKYIDQRPPGTRHCLAITANGSHTYSVVLTEIPPDPGAVPIVYRQRIQTVDAGGKTWISSIKSIG